MKVSINDFKKIVSKVILEEKSKYESELAMGVKVESEHLDIYEELHEWMEKTFDDYKKIPWSKKEFYTKIAKAHLKELPDYYTRLKKMED
jgi:uncharacterized protein YijF (DUF1287 family)